MRGHYFGEEVRGLTKKAHRARRANFGGFRRLHHHRGHGEGRRNFKGGDKGCWARVGDRLLRGEGGRCALSRVSESRPGAAG
jgi:hypothetical protein